MTDGEPQYMTSKGRVMRIRDMVTPHIVNAIRALEIEYPGGEAIEMIGNLKAELDYRRQEQEKGHG